MQALYLLGARQVSSLSTELQRFEQADEPSLTTDSQEARAAMNGQIVASLASFNRTIDDFEEMARKELIQEKREKAEGRVKKFRQDYSRLKQSYEKAKKSHQLQQATSDRDDLLGGASASSTSTSAYGSPSASRLRPRGSQQPTTMPPAESPFTFAPASSSSSRTHASKQSLGWAGGGARTNAALDESNFLGNTGNMLDQYIAQGQAILGNLHTQRDIVKGTQRRLLSVANTLGLSRETITFIERRGKGDSLVMLLGIVGTLVAFWLILRYLG